MRGDKLEGPRHPQSTRPMQKGRPLSRGGFRTRLEFVEAVRGRLAKGYTVGRIAQILGLTWWVVKRAAMDLEPQAKARD